MDTLGTQIREARGARAAIVAWHTAWVRGAWDGDITPAELIAEYGNWDAAAVDVDVDGGDVWVGDHWLRDGELVDLVEWLRGHGHMAAGLARTGDGAGQ